MPRPAGTPRAHLPRALARLSLVAALALAPAALAGAAGSSADVLREALERFLAERAPGPDRVVELPSLADFELPGVAPERVEVRLSALPRPPSAASVPVTAALLVDGAEVRRGVVTARVRSFTPVLVAVRPLSRGATLREADLRPERREVAGLPADAVADPRFAAGKQLTRAIPAGGLLRERWLEVAPVVSRGQLVELRYHSGALRIQGRGRARESGRPGDWIRVQNVSSRREITGRVDAEGVVHVAF